jgi:integrase
LKRIEARGTRETAHRVYQNICWVFRHAAATGRLIPDPSAPLKGSLQPTNEKHLASITDPKQFGELPRAIDAYSGSHTVRTALRLAPLVFVRPTELRAAEWSEIDLSIQEWLIPAARIKNGKYVFPSPRSRMRPLSNVALLAALRRMGYEQGTLTVHGFRSTASTLLNEQGFNRDWIERQLAHGERNNVRAAYNYAEYLPQRKVMMQEWADYLDELRMSSV